MSSTLPSYLTTSPPPISPPTTVRLQALYASTSAQRQSNPTGYSANVSWWSGLIEELLRAGYLGEDHLVLKVDESLLSKLEWNGGKPRGIGGFVERLSTPPITLHPLPTFLSSPTPLHASPSLTSRLIGRPLWWALSQLNPFGGGEESVKEEMVWGKFGKGREYVHMPLLEASAAAFTAHMREKPATVYSDSLYSINSFMDEFSTICFPLKDNKGKEGKLSKKDMEVLLRWLNRDCGVIVTSGDIIKILSEGERVEDHPITEADIGVVAIRDTLKKLDGQVESIEKQIQRCQQKAKHHLSLSQKSIALSHLKSKKQLEDLLLKRIGATQQLEAVLRSIDQAKGDIEIMAAYTTSTSTLKSILANPALDLDHVEKTTEELAEVMANQEEVDSAIRIGGQVAVGASGEVDDDELKRELEAMVNDEKEAQAAAVAGQVAEKEKEARRAAEKEMIVQTPTQIPSLAPATKESARESSEIGADAEAERVWRERYEEAQQRTKEEKERAEVERMRRQAKMAAE